MQTSELQKKSNRLVRLYKRLPTLAKAMLVLVAGGIGSRIGELITDAVLNAFPRLDVLLPLLFEPLFVISINALSVAIFLLIITVGFFLWRTIKRELVRRKKRRLQSEMMLAVKVEKEKHKELADKLEMQALQLQNLQADNESRIEGENNRRAALQKFAQEGQVILSEDFSTSANDWHMPFWGDVAKNTVVRRQGYIEFEAATGTWSRGSNGAILTIGKGISEGQQYIITAKFKEGRPNTTMMFQLWVHDSKGNSDIKEPPDFMAVSSEYKEVSILWEATHTKMLSIHLHCKAGKGSIIVRSLKVVQRRK